MIGDMFSSNATSCETAPVAPMLSLEKMSIPPLAVSCHLLCTEYIVFTFSGYDMYALSSFHLGTAYGNCAVV
jgi:hypothetical protein